MTNEKHPFDVAAERLEAAADRPVAGQVASADFWELEYAADATVGDFPQAVLCGPVDQNPFWLARASESEGLGADGFPAVPIPEQELQPEAHWTDVLSSNLWSEGYLLNQKALTAFTQCNLGEFREYPAIVRDQAGSQRSYAYIHIRNVIQPTAFDFERSEFYIADMLGIPKAPIAVTSLEDWLENQRRATAGELDGCERFSRIEYKKLYFKQDHLLSVDLFRLARLSSRVYISGRLRNAIMESGMTGLEIKPNKRLFADH